MHSSPPEESKQRNVIRIGFRNLLGIIFIGTAGQIAWAVENSWFNTFVFDRITEEPGVIAWMVAISAITAMITTLFMGILSDRTRGRWGKRKPFIVFGYIAWGIITAIYPMIEWVEKVSIAIILIVIADSIMSFFGSISNDAAYNAWLKDMSHSSNRNRIQSVNSITGFLANAIALIAAGIIIENYGYFVFFFALGGVVTFTGLISAVLIPSTPVVAEEIEIKKSFWKEITEIFSLRLLKENRTLFLLFINMALGGISGQVYFPYLLIFLEHYVGFSKTEMSIYLAIFIGAVIALYVIIGLFSHKFNRKPLLLYGTIINSVVTIIVGIAANYVSIGESMKYLVFILYFLATIPSIASGIAHGGWLLDKYPEGKVGKFQGIRMIFMVLLPMVIGPSIGTSVIRKWGIPIPGGYIPTPPIFIVGGLISILAVIPILFIAKSEGKVQLIEKLE